MKAVTKEQGISISISTVASFVTVVGALWLFGEPWLVGRMSTAMAGEIQETVSKSVEPIHAALEVLVQRDVKTIREEIAEMEYHRDNATDEDPWTRQDRRDLVELKTELEAFEKAAEALEREEEE